MYVLLMIVGGTLASPGIVSNTHRHVKAWHRGLRALIAFFLCVIDSDVRLRIGTAIATGIALYLFYICVRGQ